MDPNVLLPSEVDLTMVHKNFILPSNEGNEKEKGGTDLILEYAKEVLCLTLLYMEFNDAIKEGDGSRVLRCWKFLLLVFRASRRTNYSIEALNFLLRIFYLLPQRLPQQLMWSRFVNTTGKPGCNIPCDLFMEHLNRACKTSIYLH